MGETLKKYAKVLTGAGGVILSAVLAALIGDGTLSFAEFVNVVVLATGTLSLGIAPNIPGSRYVKSTLAAIAAAVTVLLSVYSDGVTSSEFWQIVVAVATAYGVYQIPNRGDTLDRMEPNVAV
jgi:hypothetical protein